jgi:hypothetical protein
MPALSMTCACLHVAIRLQRRGLLHALQITIQRGNRMVQRPTLARTGSCEQHTHCRASGAHASQNDVGRSLMILNAQGGAARRCSGEWHLQGFDAHHRHCKRRLDSSSVILATARQRTGEAARQRRLHLRRDVQTHTAAARRTAGERRHTHTAAASNEHTAAQLWRFFPAATPKALGEWRFAVTHADDAPIAPSSVRTVSSAAAEVRWHRQPASQRLRQVRAQSAQQPLRLAHRARRRLNVRRVTDGLYTRHGLNRHAAASCEPGYALGVVGAPRYGPAAGGHPLPREHAFVLQTMVQVETQ